MDKHLQKVEGKQERHPSMHWERSKVHLHLNLDESDSTRGKGERWREDRANGARASRAAGKLFKGGAAELLCVRVRGLFAGTPNRLCEVPAPCRLTDTQHFEILEMRVKSRK